MAEATITIVSKRNLPGGLREVVVSAALSNSMPAGGFAIAASNFGFSRYAAKDDGSGPTAPEVVGLDGKVLGAQVVSAKIVPYYPTGGATTAPTTIADPLSTTGASTASAVNATTPAITPGLGKALPTAADCSAVTVRLKAVGVPA